ncbi:MAG: hydrogen gas-evolving membrane-bound hydrogenase subunit E [Phycisphaerae bacterium]
MAPWALVPFAIFSPVLAGLLTLLLPKRAVGRRTAVALAGPVAAVVLLALAFGRLGFSPEPFGLAWMPALHLNFTFRFDELGAFFALLVSGIGILITLYARAYFGPDEASLFRFYPTLHLFMTAMLGLVLADNFLLILLFWEMTSISSFLLIGWDRFNDKAVKSALQAMMTTGIGGLALMGGLILLGVHTGAWSVSALTDVVAARPELVGPTLTAAFVLCFAGAAAKSAQWPLHFWLPGAMAAPTPVSAFLHSATMVKAGVYLMGRLTPALAEALPVAWPVLLVGFGAVTMVLGAFVALQRDVLKQIFAYTTVSQLGLLMTMYGLAHLEYKGEPNLIWDVAQILNHALYKAPLFLLAGAITHTIATKNLSGCRGLWRAGGHKTIMAGLLLLAAYALAAGPMTISFTAKELFFYQIYHALEVSGHWAVYPLILAGVATGMFNVAIFVRIARTLLGTPAAHDDHGHADHGHDDAHDEHAHEHGFWAVMLWLPAAVLVALQFVGGFGGYVALFGWIENSPFYFALNEFPYTWRASLGLPLYMSLTAIAAGLLLGFLPVLNGRLGDVHDKIFPAFYTLATKGGGRVFALIQTGHAFTYIAVVFLTVVGVAGAGWWYARPQIAAEAWVFEENIFDLLPGLTIAALVIIASVLMPLVKDRASRILVLGTVGFAVTGMFYVYMAPDLAITQISIEIVSLILFLLVLALLPDATPTANRRIGLRLALSLAVGVTMFFLALVSSSGDRPGMGIDAPPGSIARLDGEPEYQAAGEFFLDHSYDGSALTSDVTENRGGGGNNVVNVILVDFRGFDTLGEIIVLGLAAISVWTLLRRRNGIVDDRQLAPVNPYRRVSDKVLQSGPSPNHAGPRPNHAGTEVSP